MFQKVTMEEWILQNRELNKERKVVNRKRKEKQRIKQYYTNGNSFIKVGARLIDGHKTQKNNGAYRSVVLMEEITL